MYTEEEKRKLVKGALLWGGSGTILLVVTAILANAVHTRGDLIATVLVFATTIYCLCQAAGIAAHIGHG